MELKSKQYEKFVAFMDNLSQNKQDLITKLANCQDKLELFKREKQVLETLIPVGRAREEGIRKAQAKNPKDTLLIAEVQRLTENNSQSENKLALVTLAIEESEKEYTELLPQNSKLNPSPLADAAVKEMDSEIQRLYAAFCDSINAAVAAREVYLKTIGEVNQIASIGKHAIEAGQKAQSYGTLKLTPFGNFSTSAKQFLVSEGDVQKA